MKKYLLFGVFAVGVLAAALAQAKDNKKSVAVPQSVKEAFAAKFSGATATWEKEGTGYEATFYSNGHEMSAVFEANGNLTESEMEIEPSELPKAVVEFIKANYKKSAVKEAAKITKASGEINYEARVNGKDLIFDADGKFLKTEKD